MPIRLIICLVVLTCASPAWADQPPDWFSIEDEETGPSCVAVSNPATMLATEREAGNSPQAVDTNWDNGTVTGTDVQWFNGGVRSHIKAYRTLALCESRRAELAHQDDSYR